MNLYNNLELWIYFRNKLGWMQNPLCHDHLLLKFPDFPGKIEEKLVMIIENLNFSSIPN